MSTPLRIAIAGLGTVGCGAVEILRKQSALIAARAGRAIEIVAVSVRNQQKQRPVDVSGLHWVNSPLDLVALPQVDVIVELIGGSEGSAKQLVEAALAAGKHVVTANKALLAHHGLTLAAMAEKHNVTLAFEAAVAGGIPIINTLREGLAANQFHQITGILNGTCNFILTSMWKNKTGFAETLAEAQRIGFAEADPTFDVDGFDTAHKVAVMTSLAFGCTLMPDAMTIEGIRSVTLDDMQFADELGYTIKLLGITSRYDDAVLQRVHPALVPKTSTIAATQGGFNHLIVEGDAIGKLTLEGAGAGAAATGSSVVADLIDIARGHRYHPFALPVAALVELQASSINDLKRSYYMRLAVKDVPGVVATITGILRDESISVRSFLQHENDASTSTQIVLTTHETPEHSIQKALAALRTLDILIAAPQMIRIEPL